MTINKYFVDISLIRDVLCASFLFNDLKSTLLSKILGLKLNLNYNIREAYRPEKS
mgnify:CR=1 FL=1